MSSRQSGEGEIRAALVEADLVACMIALPPQLFRTTQIPACLWFFAKDKGHQGAKHLNDRRGDVLFIDARSMGTMLDRTERILTPEDIAKIADTYHAWRGTASAREAALKYADIPGFCYSANLEELRKQDHILTPGRYVGAAETDDGDDEPIADEDRPSHQGTLRSLRRVRSSRTDRPTSNWSALMARVQTVTGGRQATTA